MLVLFSPWATAESDGVEPLRVGMPEPGQVPFFWRDEAGEYRGIYPDTLRAISEDIGVELVFVPLSQARLVKHFVVGDIDLEAGVSTGRKAPPELTIVSLFSRPYGLVNEVIVYRPEMSFPAFILKDLKGQRVATVRGSQVPDYLVREDFSSQWQVAQRVHRGWNDVGLMREATALHYQQSEGYQYRISLPYESNPVSFRLHYQRKELLAAIDDSIEKLERSGVLEELVCNYLCGR